MTDRITLPYTNNIRGAAAAWTRTTPDMGPIVACGNGHLAGIPDHEIDAHGNITPSLQCPTEGCNWHVHARLENWDG